MVKVNEAYYEGCISSPSRMIDAGAELAREVVKEKKSRALVVSLEGELGSGKTTFAQGFIRALSGSARVLSPTFLLMKEYSTRSSGASEQKMLYHFDWYRATGPREIEALGWRGIVRNPSAIVLVEWPERAPRLIPSDALRIRFGHKSAKERILRIVVPHDA